MNSLYKVKVVLSNRPPQMAAFLCENHVANICDRNLTHWNYVVRPLLLAMHQWSHGYAGPEKVEEACEAVTRAG